MRLQFAPQLITYLSSSRLRVSKAVITNLLEDEKETLELQPCAGTDGAAGFNDTILTLAFRGFQVITLKLKVEMAPDVPPAMFAARSDESNSAQIEEWINVLKM